ncbi:hypothetical protein AVEN_8946-1 [Araneus ventricosus]|uniref:Uncharacterized protein n=1 Tax=Araneus ventricosus TaxID=182803 RepID=A0A4Y2T412_ARAVE|nr:hypothetical protein AVEN_8946-1 [Araneus ventricosus]
MQPRKTDVGEWPTIEQFVSTVDVLDMLALLQGKKAVFDSYQARRKNLKEAGAPVFRRGHFQSHCLIFNKSPSHRNEDLPGRRGHI